MTRGELVPNQRRYSALGQLTLARVREFWREPAAVFWVYVFPLLMMAALGIAFRNRTSESLTVIVQRRDGDESRLLDTLTADERFRARVASADECRRLLRTGKADLVIVPRGQRRSTDDRVPVEYVYDPTRPGSRLARNSADDVLQRAAGREDVLVTRDREVTEPGGRYIDYLVPGLVGMGIMGGGLWGVGFAIVDMRIRKLLKRYLATPMSRGQFLASIMISRLLFTVPEILVLLVFARLVFDVRNQGNYLAVMLIILIGSFEFAGIGLLVACRARTLESVSGLMNLVMLPMWMASGIFFSYERFPEVVHPAIRLLPLTPLIDSLRAVMQEGQSIWSLGWPLGVMTAWAVVTSALALRWFRWN